LASILIISKSLKEDHLTYEQNETPTRSSEPGIAYVQVHISVFRA
jgi:hypothetical protein